MTHTDTVFGITPRQVKAISSLQSRIADWGTKEMYPQTLAGFTTKVRNGNLNVTISMKDIFASHCTIVRIGTGGGYNVRVQSSRRDGFENVVKSFESFWYPVS